MFQNLVRLWTLYFTQSLSSTTMRETRRHPGHISKYDIFDAKKTDVVYESKGQSTTLRVYSKTGPKQILATYQDQSRRIKEGSYGRVRFLKCINGCGSFLEEIAIKEDAGLNNEYEIVKAMKEQHRSCNVVKLREIITPNIDYFNQKLDPEYRDAIEKYFDGTPSVFNELMEKERKQGRLEMVQEELKKCGMILNPDGSLPEKTALHIYVMEKMDSDLQDWLEARHKNEEFQYILNDMDTIVASLLEQMLCLYSVNNKFVYTDLKPKNVGLLCDQKNKIQEVYLIDLGSAMPEKYGTEYVATYPCKDHDSGYVAFNNEEEKKRCIYVSLMMLIANLLLYANVKFEMPRMNDWVYTEDHTPDFYASTAMKKRARVLRSTLFKIKQYYTTTACIKVMNFILGEEKESKTPHTRGDKKTSKVKKRPTSPPLLEKKDVFSKDKKTAGCDYVQTNKEGEPKKLGCRKDKKSSKMHEKCHRPKKNCQIINE